MRGIFFKRGRYVVTIFAILVVAFSLFGCSKGDKESILVKDVKNQSKVEKQEIKTAIDNGNKYLEEENYDKAKMWYERAISINRSKRDTYKKIEDKYWEKDRKDDAYRIIRLAIDNGVDVENMKKELKKIEDTFETIVINESIYVGEDYELPSESTLNIDGKDVDGKITWNNSKVTTNKSGIFIYKGSIPLYGRKVVMNLEIKNKELVNNNGKNDLGNESSKNEKKLCFIKEVNEENGKKYAIVDEVQYFSEEIEKDQGALLDKYTGECLSYLGCDGDKNRYWIKNSFTAVERYNISDDCEYLYMGNSLTPDGTIYQEKNMNFQEMQDYIDRYYKFYNNEDDYGQLWWVYIENNKIVKFNRTALSGLSY
ncbi:Hypothetical protein CM240_2352 [Clostridium bornimense]|uniref:Bacterial Ig-like domain-containing protein n=1 Tax=Clostridium bornimense TaxID=1216932 RepID=W6S0V9_9CLOT|nr:Ig-like domain-containing protein [Clostridium bornimense]CDM69489.1 Hypothetical protein CM240_2352 [Clostridium bornimense]